MIVVVDDVVEKIWMMMRMVVIVSLSLSTRDLSLSRDRRVMRCRRGRVEMIAMGNIDGRGEVVESHLSQLLLHSYSIHRSLLLHPLPPPPHRYYHSEVFVVRVSVVAKIEMDRLYEMALVVVVLAWKESMV